jgi:hypothetical protein
MIYSIPALTFDNEFTDLSFVGNYVDSLISIDPEYATVYQWNGDEMKGPPDVVLRRVGSAWEKPSLVQ